MLSPKVILDTVNTVTSDLKPGSNRVLVRFLWISLIVVFILFLKASTNSNNKDNRELEYWKNDSRLKDSIIRVEYKHNEDLKQILTKRDQLDNERLSERVKWQDSIITSLQSLKLPK